MNIVEEIQNDREKGAKRLESEYRAGLMTLALRLCHDSGDAAELVNRTFAEVIACIDDYAEQSAFFGWMSKILVNLHAKDVRRKSNAEIIYPGEVPEVADEKAQEDVFRNIEAAELREAIETLPEDIRKTLMLHYFMDLSVAQVAKILSVAGGTVKWRLHIARDILAAKLGAAAKKPGGKALLIVVGLLALTAAGAAGVAISGAFHLSGSASLSGPAGLSGASRLSPESLESPEGSEGLESLESPGCQPSNCQTAQPSNQLAAVDQPSNRQTVKLSNQPEEPTMSKRSLIAASAAAVLAAGAPVSASATTLPAGYTRLAYIESTGTQYIDTGIFPRANTRAVLDFRLTELPTSDAFYCGWGSSEVKEAFLFGATKNQFNVSVSSKWEMSPTGVPVDTKRHVYDIARGDMRLDGKLFSTTNTLGNSAGGTSKMYLFAAHVQWTAKIAYYAKMAIYSCRLYEGATLVRDFVPCSDENGRACLYDAVTGATYHNGASGADLVCGPVFSASLPSDYTRLRYVAATGEQYIDTGVAPTTETRVVCEFRLTEIPSSRMRNGWAASSSTMETFWFGIDNDLVNFSASVSGNSVQADTGVPVNTLRHTFDISTGGIIFDGSPVANPGTAFTDAASGNTMYLFASRQGWTPNLDKFCKMELYSYRIYSGDTPVRDLVPCLDANGNACLYDIVNGTPYYYYRASGADLVAGPRLDLPTLLMLR